MAHMTWRKSFAALLILCVVMLVTVKIYQIRTMSMTNAPSLLQRITTYQDEHNKDSNKSTQYQPTEKSVQRLTDDEPVLVYPLPSGLTFPWSVVLPYYYRILQTHHPSDKHRIHPTLTVSPPNLSLTKKESMLILFYNRPGWFASSLMPFCREGLSMCPIKACKCSTDSHDLTRADAVIVDGPELKLKTPMTKKASQVWIFFALESPFYFRTQNYKRVEWRRMFNWTMTYRLDSDIPVPYDKLVRQKVSKNYTAIALRKTKSAVWLVSNCKTPGKRDRYVKELTKYYSVDVFGKCTSRPQVDYVRLLHDYRFYLSFENSICFDYVTEKFFKAYHPDLNIIPVARGGASYDTLFPKGTFINTAHFNSPKELGEYLTYLEKNVTAYADFLQRNDQYKPVGKDPVLKNSFCDVCVKMHNVERFENLYTDIGNWYNDATCSVPNDY